MISVEEKRAAYEEARQLLLLGKKWQQLMPGERKPDFTALGKSTVPREPDLDVGVEIQLAPPVAAGDHQLEDPGRLEGRDHRVVGLSQLFGLCSVLREEGRQTSGTLHEIRAGLRHHATITEALASRAGRRATV